LAPRGAEKVKSSLGQVDGMRVVGCSKISYTRPQMKKQRNPTQGSSPKNLQTKSQPARQFELIKLGVDAHADSYKVVRQIENGSLEPVQGMGFKKFLAWAEKQKALAKRVVVCYEAGTFGFYPARCLEKLSIECLVMVPIKLDEGNTRVTTDRLDARRIAVRLDRYLCGDKEALNVVRIPTPEEEEQRDVGRQRQALVKDLKRYAERGRAYLRRQGQRVKGRWWEGTKWQVLQGQLTATQLAYLQPWKEMLTKAQEILGQVHGVLIAQAEKHVQTKGLVLPAWLGLLTYELLRLEVCDWKRFNNRRQVASMTGLCASESSSGQSRRQGAVTKHGNPVLRWVLLELAWRMVRYQPGCYAVRKWQKELAASGGNRSRRKKIIVAIARQLAIDLWRVATGQSTFAKLGYNLPSAPSGKAKTVLLRAS
jgi:transposase